MSVTYNFLNTILPSLFTDQKSVSLGSVTQKIGEDARTSTEKTSDEIVRAIQSCILHHAEISTWFGGALGGVNADKIVANVLRFKNDGGQFIGRTPKARGGSGLDLGCGHDASSYFRINGVRLQEQVRAAVFVGGGLNSADRNGLSDVQREALSEFIEGHEIANRIVSAEHVFLLCE